MSTSHGRLSQSLDRAQPISEGQQVEVLASDLDEILNHFRSLIIELGNRANECAQIDAAKSAAAIAWGWLWHVTTADDRVKTARHLLGQMLDKDLKRYGIQTAKDEGAQVNVQEIEAAMLRGEFGDA